jgi:hypothetical protein
LLRLLFAQGIQYARKIYVDDRPHAARLGHALSSKKSRAQANAHGLRRRSDAAGRHHCGAGADLAHQLLELGDKKEAPGCHRPARCAYSASAIFISAKRPDESFLRLADGQYARLASPVPWPSDGIELAGAHPQRGRQAVVCSRDPACSLDAVTGVQRDGSSRLGGGWARRYCCHRSCYRRCASEGVRRPAWTRSCVASLRLA